MQSGSICIISKNHWNFARGGSELQCKYISEYINRNGRPIHYIFLNNDKINSINNNIVLHGIKVKNIEKWVGGVCYFYDFYKILKKINPDSVYLRSFYEIAIPLLLYTKVKKRKVILHIPSSKIIEKLKYKIRGNLFRQFQLKLNKKLLIRFSDKIIAQAQYQSDLMEKNFARKADNIIHNFHPVPSKINQAKKARQIIWVANFRVNKHPEIFINLAKEEKFQDIEFIMIGKNPKNSWTEHILKSIEDVPNLTFYGEKDLEFVNNCIAQSLILINTSDYEGFPNTYIQAWMRAVPVISLNIDPDNLMQHHGLGFKSENVNQMVQDIQLLLTNEALRIEIGNKAREFSLNNFSLKNCKLIEQLL